MVARDNTIKNGKYGDAERERLSSYAHPNYGPDLRRRGSTYTPEEIQTHINEDSANWRRPLPTGSDEDND